MRRGTPQCLELAVDATRLKCKPTPPLHLDSYLLQLSTQLPSYTRRKLCGVMVPSPHGSGSGPRRSATLPINLEPRQTATPPAPPSEMTHCLRGQ
jgi:hypothetical protein